LWELDRVWLMKAACVRLGQPTPSIPPMPCDSVPGMESQWPPVLGAISETPMTVPAVVIDPLLTWTPSPTPTEGPSQTATNTPVITPSLTPLPSYTAVPMTAVITPFGVETVSPF